MKNGVICHVDSAGFSRWMQTELHPPAKDWITNISSLQSLGSSPMTVDSFQEQPAGTLNHQKQSLG